MPASFTRHVDGYGNHLYANDLNELQVAIEQVGLYSASGDILVGSATGWPPNRLASGAAGQVLTVQSDLTLAWQAQASGFANPMTTLGDVIRGGTVGAATRVGIGTTNQVLTVVGGVPAWANAASGFTDPETTAGDMIFRNASNVTSRLPAGTAGQVLTLAGTPPVPAWAAASGGMTNPMTTLGDVITGGTAGAAQRLGVGGAGQVLTVVSGAPAWANAASGFTNPMTTKGDIIAGGTAGAATRLAVGANGQALIADSTQTLGLKWSVYALNAPLIYHYRRSTAANGTANWSATTVGYSASLSGTIGPFINGVLYDVEVIVGVQCSAPTGDFLYVSAGFSGGGTPFTAEVSEGYQSGERFLMNSGSWQITGDGTTTYTAGLGLRSGNGGVGFISNGVARVHCYPRS